MTATAHRPASKEAYPAFEEMKERPISRVDYRSEGGPLLSYLWTSSDEELAGQTLYLGGEIGSDGCIYFIPGHAARVLVCDPKTDTLFMIGPEFPGKFKWLRGVVNENADVIYGIPCNAPTVLRIHVPSRQVSAISIPYHEFYDDSEALQHYNQDWKYHGAATCPLDGCIYAIPQSAQHVLKIDPTSETCHLVGPELIGRYKWYGGVVGKHDGAIYGLPHNSAHVLRIHPEAITLHGDFGTGGHKWHGGSAARNGDIVAVPANADTVLCIRPGTMPELWELGGDHVVQTGRHRNDRKYKYLGSMMGTDGKVYCFPSGSERVLQIDTDSNTVRQVGPNLYDERLERLCQNKWQNGLVVTHEQCVYGIPLAAESLLKIDCSHDPPKVTTWLLPAPYRGLAKWEGGITTPNGAIYTVPNNHKAVLKIETSTSAGVSATSDRRKGDASLPYQSGIPTLRSSAHRVKFNPKNRKHDPKPKNRAGEETKTTWVPQALLSEDVFSYDATRYNLQDAVSSLLLKCDSNTVGEFREGSSGLEAFRVPVPSTWRTVNGGQCEAAQAYLSQMVASDESFLEAFDRFVLDVVLPYLKRRLITVGAVVDEPDSVIFFYQRPPTIRLQPGPAWAQVKPHNDSEYGHQNGELNFWVPLTDRGRTGVDLWSESKYLQGDYHPVPASLGEVVAFHGSSCRHYVNSNASTFTRVSLDFRVGVEGFFDPEWEMRGTTDDHSRRKARL